MGANAKRHLENVEWDSQENSEALIPLEFTEEIKPDLFGLEESRANEMVSGLSITLAERKALENSYIDVISLEITTETLPKFKELRLKIVKNRTQGLDKWKEKEKSFYLAGGNFVQAIYNKELRINQDMESKLLEAEKFFENQEKEKARLLNLERIEKIRFYIDDADKMDFSSFDDESFDDYVLGKKTRYESEAIAKEEERLRIETERLAEIERQKTIELENAKLKAEAEAKELELKKEREEQAKKEAELKAIADAKEREIERERADAKVKADALEAENQRKLKEERDAREKVENEIRLQKEAKEKADLLAKKEAEKLAKAPIKKQHNVWVDSFSLPIRNFDSDVSKDIVAKFISFKAWAQSEIDKM